MNETEIAWTEVTWNPASGCDRVSEGCRYCYAETLAEKYRGTSAFPNGFDLTIREHKLKEPVRLKKPSLVFVNSMSDLFWEKIPDSYRHRIVDVIEATPQHQYQVLTKRPEAMLAWSKHRPLPANFWAGTTIESQRWVDRLEILKQVKAEIRFVSAEPLLSGLEADWTGIHWVIVGGESGNHLTDPKVARERALVWRPIHENATRKVGAWTPRPERIDWVRRIRDDVHRTGGKFFFKQFGGVRPKSGGNTLDGKTYLEFPRLPERGAWRNLSLPVVK